MTRVDLALGRAFSRAGKAYPNSSDDSASSGGSSSSRLSISPRFVSRSKAFRWNCQSPTSVEFAWPPVVLTLTRDHGASFLRLAEGLIQSRQQTLWLTSGHRSEGRTTLALALAMALVRLSKQVLIIDADLSSPKLGGTLGVLTALGLDDILYAARPWRQAIIRDAQTRLAALPIRQRSQTSSDFWKHPTWHELMPQLRGDFDHIIFDGGPLFDRGASSSIPHWGVDGAILVRRQGPSRPSDWQRAQHELSALGIPLLGWAETFVRPE